MDSTIFELAIQFGAPSAITGFWFWILKRNMDKRDAKQDQEDKIRQEKEIILMRSITATIKLGEATACAVRDGTCNGTMTAALAYAKTVKEEQDTFLMEQGIRNIYKN